MQQQRTGSGIVLTTDGALMGESDEELAAAVEAGVIFPCPHGVGVKGPLGHAWPCGFAHTGPRFYHLAEGKSQDDYNALWEQGDDHG